MHWNIFSRKQEKIAQTKQSATGSLMVRMQHPTPAFTPRQFDQLAKEGYQKNAIVYRCIRLISQNAAAVPWTVFDGAHKLDDHPLLSLLRQPNPLQGASEFFESVYGFYLIAGNSYVEQVAPNNTPRELWSLRPDRMRVIAGSHGAPEGYRYQANGNHKDFRADPLTGDGRILHLKSFHPLDDWYGMSPLEAAAFSIDQHNDAAKWNAALLQSGARPSGAIVYKPQNGQNDSLTDDQRRHLKDEIAEFFSGAGNAGKPMVLEGGLDWREMSMSPKDMDWLSGKDVSAREIAMAFHVPPQLIGIDGSMTFANFEQARLALFDDAILPMVEHVKTELNRWLAPKFGSGIRISYDTDAIEALSPRREKVWQRISSADFMTVNEKRAALGLSPVANGDAL